MYDEDARSPLGNDRDDVTKIHKKYRSALDHTSDWREEASTAFDYVAGNQWSEEDLARLEEQERPYVTFNRTEVFVHAVTGLEALNRQEVKFLPRNPGPVDTGQADIWTAAAEYVNDESDAETHHSAAFKDTIICGMGWTETRMDFEMNPDGDILVEHRDPLYMYWDPRASQRNLSDARWLICVTPYAMEEVKSRWPKKSDDIIYSRIFEPDYEPESPHDSSEAWKYEHDQSAKSPTDDQEVYVAQYQYFEIERFYRIQLQGESKEVPEKWWNRLKDKNPEAAAQIELSNRIVGPFPKRTYKRKFICGWTVLEEQTLVSNDFTLHCITGKQDRNHNIWYGLVRPLKDPQDWVNKLYSEILFIIATNAKGGLLAEKDAFENPQKAEDDWSSADKIVWTKPGAVQNGKITPKPTMQYPAGLERLMEFGMSMFQDVTGASMELLGLAQKVQPGVLEQQRKQAGMTILSWAFDSLRAYRKRHGRVLATYIREFIADGRLIRIVGQEGQQFLPLVKDALNFKYDVIVDESPQSTNEKERTFAVLMNLLSDFVNMGIQPPPTFFDYLPIPAALAEEWKKQMQPDPKKQQMDETTLLESIKKLIYDNENKQADTKKKLAEAQLKEVQAQVEPLKI